MKRFQGYILDLDGTIMGDDGVISSRTRRALAAAQARGVEVTLATGRMFQATLPFARELRITSPLICYQGSIEEIKENEEVRKKYLLV